MIYYLDIPQQYLRGIAEVTNIGRASGEREKGRREGRSNKEMTGNGRVRGATAGAAGVAHHHDSEVHSPDDSRNLPNVKFDLILVPLSFFLSFFQAPARSRPTR